MILQRVPAHSFRRAQVAFLLLVLGVALWTSLAFAQAPAPGRIVAIGDIHGELDGVVGILQKAGVVDATQKWAGGNTTLVVTGDFIDRGAKSRAVMDLLMALEKQAPKSGGRTFILLGNHEAMNIYGDLRYVTPEIYATFASGNSEKRRQSAWRTYQGFLRARARAQSAPEPVFTPEMQAAWMTAHPPGFFEHRDAFAPKGNYGRWLRTLPPIAQVGDIIFVHAGISPAVGTWKIADVTLRVHNEIQAFDNFADYLVQQKMILPFFTEDEILASAKEDYEARQAVAASATSSTEPTAADRHRMDVLKELLEIGSWLSVNPDGPLWFRGFASWNDQEGPEQVDKILAARGAKHFVVGHSTIRGGKILPRFGGSVFLIDTGMLTSYYPGGRAAALEILGGKFTAIYPDERVVLLDSAAAPRSGLPAPDEFEAAGAALGGGAQQPAAAPEKPRRAWNGPDGNPLPFKSEEELMEFMRTAKVVSMRTIGQGITMPRKAVLEKDGIRMHAIFRDIEEQRDRFTGAAGTTELFFRDSYMFEMAAFELSRLLGIDFVPPTVSRRLQGQSGSMQVWVENALDEGKRTRQKVNPPDVEYWRQELGMMRAFDALIYNTDRNVGNILYGPDWKFWSIDHTRAFRRHDTLKDPHLVTACDRTFWEKLHSVNDETIRARLKPYLQQYEIDGLLKRRKALVALIQKLINERGEDKFLFSLR